MKKLPDLGKMPAIGGISAWFNTDAPITKEGMRGKVVMIDFMTYSCVNCIRTFPHLSEWHERYADKGLLLVGIHTPEFDFEKIPGNVEEALKKYGLTFPIGLDSEYVTWLNFNNTYWPSTYLFDPDGTLRYSHFGEGSYEETEAAIRSLLKERGETLKRGRPKKYETPEFSRIATPEIYLGYSKMTRLGSPEALKKNAAQTYSMPESADSSKFYFIGDWRIEAERAISKSQGAKIVFIAEANAVNLVAKGPDGKPAEAVVRVSGRAPGIRRSGKDIDAGGRLTISEPRLYGLIDMNGQYDDFLFEIEFSGSGTEAYAFTFG